MPTRISGLLFFLFISLVIAAGCGKKSESELFTIAENAQNSGKPMDAIKAYRTLVDDYPSSPHRPKALFMIGFVYSEELADTSRAIKAFESFLKEYPGNDLASSAQFMVKTLKGEATDPISIGQ